MKDNKKRQCYFCGKLFELKHINPYFYHHCEDVCTPENKKGWTKPSKESGERPVRTRSHGMFGQEVWYELQKRGFVAKDVNLSEFERKLQTWLIWGYFEK